LEIDVTHSKTLLKHFIDEFLVLEESEEMKVERIIRSGSIKFNSV